MDHGRPLGSIKDDQLEQVPGLVGAQHQVTDRILVGLFHDHRVAEDVVGHPRRRSDGGAPTGESHYGTFIRGGLAGTPIRLRERRSLGTSRRPHPGQGRTVVRVRRRPRRLRQRPSRSCTRPQESAGARTEGLARSVGSGCRRRRQLRCTQTSRPMANAAPVATRCRRTRPREAPLWSSPPRPEPRNQWSGILPRQRRRQTRHPAMAWQWQRCSAILALWPQSRSVNSPKRLTKRSDAGHARRASRSRVTCGIR